MFSGGDGGIFMNKRQRQKQKARREQQVSEHQREEQKGKFTKKKIIISTGTLGVIITILGFATQFFDLRLPIRSNPKADLAEKSIDVEYLKDMGERKGKEIYPLFQDKVELTQENVFEVDCATQVFITNDYDEEILLDKIMFEAKNIKVNTEPVILIGTVHCSETEASLTIWNKGWGDAENIILKFEDPENDINRYLKPEKHSIEVDLLKHGESVDVPLWKNTDFLSDGTFYMTVTCWEDDKQLEHEYVSRNERISVTVVDGNFMMLGSGAPSVEIYGIMIDTSKESYREEASISEYIESKRRLELPICFSADKSCDFSFRVGFEVIKRNNKKEEIWTDFADIRLKISSIWDETEEANRFTEKELEERAISWLGGVVVTYPYVGKDTLKYVEPLLQ